MTDDPDEVGIALRRMATEQRLLDLIRENGQKLDIVEIDPALVEKVEGDIASGDLYALIGTMCEYLRAMGRATGKPRPDLVKRMRALRRLLPEDEG